MNLFFEDFLRTNAMLWTHTVSRNCPNTYTCEKTNTLISRKETVSEHIIWCLKLADFFFFSHTELLNQYNRLRVKELLEFHDDIEWLPWIGDVCIADEKRRIEIENSELHGLSLLASKYPIALQNHFLECDFEFREKKTPESIFANAIDKLQPLIYCEQYPGRWWPSKWFTEELFRRKSEPSIKEVPIIHNYFEKLITHFNKSGHFKD
jgi:hypothetical protein